MSHTFRVDSAVKRPGSDSANTDTVDTVPFLDADHDLTADSSVMLSATARAKTGSVSHSHPLAASSTTTTASSSTVPSSRRRRHSYQPTTLYGDASPLTESDMGETASPAAAAAATPRPAAETDSVGHAEAPSCAPCTPAVQAKNSPLQLPHRRASPVLPTATAATSRDLPPSTRRATVARTLPEGDDLQEWKEAAVQLLKQWEKEKAISHAYRREYGSLRTSVVRRATHVDSQPQTPLGTPQSASLDVPSAVDVATTVAHRIPTASALHAVDPVVESLQQELQQSQALQKELRALLEERDKTIEKLRSELQIAKAAATRHDASPPSPPVPTQADETIVSSLVFPVAERARQGSLSVSVPHAPSSTRDHSGESSTGNSPGRRALVLESSTGGGATSSDDATGPNASFAAVSPLSTNMMSPSPPSMSPSGARLDASGSFRRSNNPAARSRHGVGSGSSAPRMTTTPPTTATTTTTAGGVVVPTTSASSAEGGGHASVADDVLCLPSTSVDSPSLLTTVSSIALPHVLGTAGTVRHGGAGSDAAAGYSPQTLSHICVGGGAPHALVAHSVSASPDTSFATAGAVAGGPTHEYSSRSPQASSVTQSSPLFTRAQRAPMSKWKPLTDVHAAKSSPLHSTITGAAAPPSSCASVGAHPRLSPLVATSDVATITPPPPSRELIRQFSASVSRKVPTSPAPAPPRSSTATETPEGHLPALPVEPHSPHSPRSSPTTATDAVTTNEVKELNVAEGPLDPREELRRWRREAAHLKHTV